ncbi:MAG: hypothetical protein R3211_01755 [Balneolaceae bacterium]|nr:hypothetical protein [Balneolaceae bacterium]
MNISKTYRLAWFLVLLLVGISSAVAQTTADTTGTDDGFIQRSVKITGQVGAYGELYGISGRESRRPSSTGRIFLMPKITFLNQLSLNFNIMLTTEGVSARQNMSQLGLDPSWGWGDAHIGDFSETFSKYTLDGITIRGGGVNLRPGDGVFRFSAVAGRSKRSVRGGAQNKSYNRTIYGGKIGVGKENASHIDLILVRAKDDLNSLPPDTSLVTTDSLFADTTVVGNPPSNPFAITPQENIVGGISWRLDLAEAISWESEVTGSIFTKDLRSSPIEPDRLDIPGVVESFYTPRFSSSADFVVDSRVSLRLSKFSGSFGYKWIGPGYTSLGTAYLINDQQAFNTNLSFRLSSTRISVNYTRQNDNLLEQKRFTNVQNRYGGSLNNRFGDNWNSNITANITIRDNDAASDSSANRFDNLALSTNQTFTFSGSDLFQNLNLNYTYQSATTEVGVLPASENRTHSFNGSLSFQFSENLRGNARLGLVSNQVSDTLTTNVQTYGVGLNHSALDNRMTNSLSVTASARSGDLNFRTRLSSNYKLTDKDVISLNLSMTNFTTDTAGRSDFNEFVGSLRITHRF